MLDISAEKNPVEGAVAFEELLDLLNNGFDKVLQVYRGRADRCYCGCAGNYAETLRHYVRDHPTSPPSSSDPDLVKSTRKAKARLAEMVKRSGTGAQTQGWDGMTGERLITVEYGFNMALTVYFARGE
jgi:hypothetical protein